MKSCSLSAFTVEVCVGDSTGDRKHLHAFAEGDQMRFYVAFFIVVVPSQTKPNIQQKHPPSFVSEWNLCLVLAIHDRWTGRQRWGMTG